MPSTQIPAPLGGWNTLDAVAGMKLAYAPTLDNFVIGEGEVKVRPGYRGWATGMPERINGLIAWQSGLDYRVFAGSGAGLFDVTGSGPVGPPVVGGLSGAPLNGTLMTAPGGNFLLVYNGDNLPVVFDGANWSAWTATGVPSGVSWANAFKGRLFVGSRTRNSFYYGGSGAYTGAFSEFPLYGVSQRGGGVIGMATWTLDGGEGPDDYAAFITSEGEVLVYKGTDPSLADAWSKVGTFAMPKPLGDRCLQPFGGDVLVLTEGGVFPLSKVVAGIDAAALTKAAATRQIEPTFLEMARARRSQSGWQLVPLGSYGLWLVNAPWGAGDAQQIAFRSASGAPSRFTGLAASCWLESNGRAFFGHASAGTVMLWGEDDDDWGTAIAAEAVQAFSDFGSTGLLKRFTLAEPILTDAAGADLKVEMATDWRVPTPEAISRGPGAPPIDTPNLAGFLVWDQGNWDEKKWLGPSAAARAWRSVRGIGQSGAIRLRVVANGSRPGWLGTGVVWEKGGALR